LLNSPAILLSTFNGEKYLNAMLDSVASQTGIAPVLYWRDDGSSDSSIDIVEGYRNTIDLKRLHGSTRLGPCASFLEVLRVAAPHHTSFHFADQDDVWHPGKVARAHHAVTKSETPRLFHCRQELVDSNGQLLRLSRVYESGTFRNALCENIAAGCTVAFNHSAAKIIASGQPTRAQMHDWWAYLVVSAVGDIEYDSHPWIQYRQHSHNAIGVSRGPVHECYKRIHRHFNRPSNAAPIFDQLSELLNIHGAALTKEQRIRVQRLLNGRKSISQRLRNFISPPAVRQRWIDNMILRGILLKRHY
jgi:glycosyltransferase involved in cell wall biosynthesis